MEMDRLEAMSILVTAVEVGSLSAASRRLGTPLATVSRKVSELEAYLGTRLLNRSSRRLTLTDAGRSYVAACKRILDDVGEAERAASGEYSTPRGDLIITAPIVFGRLHVLPVVSEFLKTYPEIDIRMALADRVDIRHRKVRSVGADSLAAHRQYRGSRHRCGHRGRRHHARALVPGRDGGTGGHACRRAGGIRAGAIAGQSRLWRRAAAGAQAARLSRFRRTAIEGTVGREIQSMIDND